MGIAQIPGILDDPDSLETGKAFSRVLLLQEILISIEKWYGKLKNQGFPVVIQRWKELSLTLGKRIRIVDASGDIEGEATDLDKDGGLVIRKDAGVFVKRMTGDVVQIR